MTFEERIEGIPYGGWWKLTARDAFLKVGKVMLAKGFSEDEAVDALEAVYSAVADCFGD